MLIMYECYCGREYKALKSALTHHQKKHTDLEVRIEVRWYFIGT